MLTKQEIEKNLPQFYGTQAYYTNKLIKFVYTDGVKYVWQSCDAYWLLIAISSYQHDPKIRKMPFQVWRLEVKDNQAVLTMKQDSGRPIEVEQKIPYTNFPLDEMDMWLIDDGTNVVLILPSEY